MKQSVKEKEKAEKLKELRRELEEKIEEQFPEGQDETYRVDIQKADEAALNDPAVAKQVVEALLFTAGKPLTAAEIRKTLKSLTPGQITKLVEELKEEYRQTNRSFEIIEIANGFEISTKKEFAPWILKQELQKRAKQVTQSALETLAILAYKQPITRAEIEALRGVDISGVLTTLSERDLVKIVGKKDVPGRPFLYGTTEKFLEHFGLRTLKDLPDIAEIQSLIHTSVRKEDLIGREKMVQINEEQTESQPVIDNDNENEDDERNVSDEPQSN